MAHIFFDFDSTLISIESLDLLIISKLGEAGKEQVERITHGGMGGTIPFYNSLKNRLNLVDLTKEDIELFSQKIPTFITKGMPELIEKYIKKGHTLHLLSGGFEDYMHPSAEKLGIKNIHANNFIYNNQGFAQGFIEENPLCKNGGKPNKILNLNINDKIVMIGDGSTDLEVYEQGVTNCFIGYFEHIKRENVAKKAPFCAYNTRELDVLLEQLLS